ncbi:conserved Plasmodium protein, unknown function [Plasmodium sp. gorilla clade G2]|uniref:conserved Plasmodium protein, unknown function n=1 Tax=Plasmodium sp. gorilla clade G2 TaxID=880535 RepID=UPI000D20B7AF|nr:conserved Plasmodium protein, unknown function [Plasmodium sp. gorilla clade G2]SOV19649.1 conserved Plasmodium protein, unknown function [Plasmodium sp. gorilla clade G2]
MINENHKGDIKIDNKLIDIQFLNDNIKKYDRHNLRTTLRKYIRDNNRLLNYYKFNEIVNNFENFKNVFIIYTNSFLQKNKIFNYTFRYSKIIKILYLNKKGKRLIYGDNYIKDTALNLNKNDANQKKLGFLLDKNKNKNRRNKENKKNKKNKENKGKDKLTQDEDKENLGFDKNEENTKQSYNNNEDIEIHKSIPSNDDNKKKDYFINFHYQLKEKDINKLEHIISHSNISLPTFSYFDIYLFSNNKKIKYEINKKNIKYIDINSVLYCLYISVIISYIYLNDFRNAYMKFFEYIYFKRKLKKLRKNYNETEKRKLRFSSLISSDLKSKIYNYYDALYEKRASVIMQKIKRDKKGNAKNYEKIERQEVNKEIKTHEDNNNSVTDFDIIKGQEKFNEFSKNKFNFLKKNNKKMKKKKIKKNVSIKQDTNITHTEINIKNDDLYNNDYKHSDNIINKYNSQDMQNDNQHMDHKKQMDDQNFIFHDVHENVNHKCDLSKRKNKINKKFLYRKNMKKEESKVISKKRKTREVLQLDEYILYLKIKYKEKSLQNLTNALTTIYINDIYSYMKRFKSIMNIEHDEKKNMLKKERILKKYTKMNDKKYYSYNYFFDVLIYFTYFKQINIIEGLLIMAFICSKLNFVNISTYIYKNVYLYFYFIFEKYQKKNKKKPFHIGHEINKFSSFKIKKMKDIDYLNDQNNICIKDNNQILDKTNDDNYVKENLHITKKKKKKSKININKKKTQKKKKKKKKKEITELFNDTNSNEEEADVNTYENFNISQCVDSKNYDIYKNYSNINDSTSYNVKNETAIYIYEYLIHILKDNKNFYMIHDFLEENKYFKNCNYNFLNNYLNIANDYIIIATKIKNALSLNNKHIFYGIRKHILIYLNLINYVETKYIFYENNYNLKNLVYHLYIDKIVKSYDFNLYTYEKNLYVLRRILFLDSNINIYHLYNNFTLNDNTFKSIFYAIYENLSVHDTYLITYQDMDEKNLSKSNNLFNNTIDDQNIYMDDDKTKKKKKKSVYITSNTTDIYNHYRDSLNFFFNLKMIKRKKKNDDDNDDTIYQSVMGHNDTCSNNKTSVQFKFDNLEDNKKIKDDNHNNYDNNNNNNYYYDNNNNNNNDNNNSNNNIMSEKNIFQGEDTDKNINNTIINIDDKKKKKKKSNYFLNFYNKKIYEKYNNKRHKSEIILNMSYNNMENIIKTKNNRNKSFFVPKKSSYNIFHNILSKRNTYINNTNNDNIINYKYFPFNYYKYYYSYDDPMNNVKNQNLKTYFNFKNNQLKLLIYNFLYLYIFDEYIYMHTHKKDINEYFNFVNVLKKKQKLRYRVYHFFCKSSKDIGDEITYYKKYIKEKYLKKNKRKDNKMYNSMIKEKGIDIKMKKDITFKSRNKKENDICARNPDGSKNLLMKENKSVSLKSLFIDNKKNYSIKSIHFMRDIYRKNYINYHMKINIEKYEHICFLFLITEMLSVVLLPYINFHIPFVYTKINKNINDMEFTHIDKFRFENKCYDNYDDDDDYNDYDDYEVKNIEQLDIQSGDDNYITHNNHNNNNSNNSNNDVFMGGLCNSSNLHNINNTVDKNNLNNLEVRNKLTFSNTYNMKDAKKKEKKKVLLFNKKKGTKSTLKTSAKRSKKTYYHKKVTSNAKNETLYIQKYCIHNENKIKYTIGKRNSYNLFNRRKQINKQKITGHQKKKYNKNNLKKNKDNAIYQSYDDNNNNIYYIGLFNMNRINDKLCNITNLNVGTKSIIEQNFLYNDYYSIDINEFKKIFHNKGKYFLIKKYEKIIALAYFTRFNTYLIFSLYERIAMLNYLYSNYNSVISILRYLNYVHCKLINKYAPDPYSNKNKKKTTIQNIHNDKYEYNQNDKSDKYIFSSDNIYRGKNNPTIDNIRLNNYDTNEYNIEHNRYKNKDINDKPDNTNIFFYMKNEDIPFKDYIFNTYSTNYINDRKYITEESNKYVNENIFEKIANIKSFRFSLFFDIFFELKVNFNHLINSHICVQNGLKYLFFYMKNCHKFNLIIDCEQKVKRIEHMNLFYDNITDKEKEENYDNKKMCDNKIYDKSCYYYNIYKPRNNFENTTNKYKSNEYNPHPDENIFIKTNSGVVLSKKNFLELKKSGEYTLHIKDILREGNTNYIHKEHINHNKKKTNKNNSLNDFSLNTHVSKDSTKYSNIQNDKYNNMENIDYSNKSSECMNKKDTNNKYKKYITNDIFINNKEYIFDYKLDMNKLRGSKLYFIIGISLLKQINTNPYYDNIKEVHFIYEEDDLINKEININNIVKNDYTELLQLSYKYIMKSIHIDPNSILNYYYLCIIYLYNLKINKCIYICKHFLIRHNIYDMYTFPFFMLSLTVMSCRTIQGKSKRKYEINYDNNNINMKHNYKDKYYSMHYRGNQQQCKNNKMVYDHMSPFEKYNKQYASMLDRVKINSPNFFNSITNIKDIYNMNNKNVSNNKNLSLDSNLSISSNDTNNSNKLCNISNILNCNILKNKEDEIVVLKENDEKRLTNLYTNKNEHSCDEKRKNTSKKMIIFSDTTNKDLNNSTFKTKGSLIDKNIINNEKNKERKISEQNKKDIISTKINDDLYQKRELLNKDFLDLLNKAMNIFCNNFFFLYIYVYYIIHYFSLYDILFIWERKNKKKRNEYKKYNQQTHFQNMSLNNLINCNGSESDMNNENNNPFNIMNKKNKGNKKLTNCIKEEIDKILFSMKILEGTNSSQNDEKNIKNRKKLNTPNIYQTNKKRTRYLYNKLSYLNNINKNYNNNYNKNNKDYIDISNIKLLPCCIPILVILYKYIHRNICSKKTKNNSDVYIYFYIHNLMSEININKITCDLHKNNCCNDGTKKDQIDDSNCFFIYSKENEQIINKNNFFYNKIKRSTSWINNEDNTLLTKHPDDHNNNVKRKISLKNIYLETMVWIGLSEIFIYLNVYPKLIVYLFHIINTYINFYLSLNKNNNTYNYEKCNFFYNLTHQFMCVKCLFLFYLYNRSTSKKIYNKKFKRKQDKLNNNIPEILQYDNIYSRRKKIILNKENFMSFKNIYIKILLFERETQKGNIHMDIFDNHEILIENNYVCLQHDHIPEYNFKLPYRIIDKNKKSKSKFWPFKTKNKDFNTRKNDIKDINKKNKHNVVEDVKKENVEKNHILSDDNQKNKINIKEHKELIKKLHLDEKKLFNSFFYHNSLNKRHKEYKIIKNLKIYLSLMTKIYYNDRKVQILYARYYFLKQKYIKVINILSLLNDHYKKKTYYFKRDEQGYLTSIQKENNNKSNNIYLNNILFFHLNNQSDFLYEYINIYMYYQSYIKLKNYKKANYYKNILNTIFLYCPIIPFHSFPFINL